MLDQDTKRRIDSARQILVGKVPDPKAQVEQITTALIYKFMDDMDRENEELGSKARFITGKLKQYAWGRLLSRELSGQERLLLYMDALTEFSKSEQIPELFRTIFKGTFLPYRDPETLNLFLKEINHFSYDHSEQLGNAYEYLLSILGSQGDAGQFRTPRHIIDFIVEVVNPKKTDKILDPACGTAGFLISAYKHIWRENSSNYKADEFLPSFAKKEAKDIAMVEIQSNGKYKGDKLNPATRKKLGDNIIGYDISPDMVRLSLVNMYLHGFNTPKILEYDSLTYEDRWGEMFDIILANPPFMSPKGGIRPHKRFQIQANRSELLFVDYIAEHLTLRGRAGVIVPEGIIFQSNNAYKNLRKMLLEENYLWAVVSLPAGVFKPYSGVKTSILFLDREQAKKNNEILFAKVSNDGFDLGDQRRAIKKNDLPELYSLLHEWQKGNKTESQLAHWVNKKEILESGDFNLTGNRYRKDIMVDLSRFAVDIQKLLEPQKKLLNSVRQSVEKSMEPFQQITEQLNKEFEQVNSIITSQAFCSLNDDLKRITESIQESLKSNNFQQVLEYAKKLQIETQNKWPMVKLGDVCEIKKGTAITKKQVKEGKIPVIAGGQQPAYFHSEYNRTSRVITVSASGAYAGFVNFFTKPIFASDCSTIKSLDENKLLTKYIYLLLRGKQDEIYKLQTGMGQPHVYPKDLQKIQIPLPPLEVQKEIIMELDGYQRVIDGAHQIVNNWKPMINVAQDWELKTIKDIATLEYGIGESAKDVGEYRYIRITDIGENGKLKNSDKKYISATKESKNYLLKKGDILVARTGATFGKTLYFEEDEISAFAGFLIRINFDKNKVLPKYYWCFAQSEGYWNQAHSLMTGGGQPQFNANAVKKIRVPLPSLEDQNKIVETIESEQLMVESAKKLIAIHEQKINNKISEVWGK